MSVFSRELSNVLSRQETLRFENKTWKFVVYSKFPQTFITRHFKFQLEKSMWLKQCKFAILFYFLHQAFLRRLRMFVYPRENTDIFYKTNSQEKYPRYLGVHELSIRGNFFEICIFINFDKNKKIYPQKSFWKRRYLGNTQEFYLLNILKYELSTATFEENGSAFSGIYLLYFLL